MRRKPAGIKRIAGALHVGHHVVEVGLDVGRQHEAVVQLRAPARGGRGVGRAPETGHQRTHQQLLRDGHAGVRRHLEGAHLQQSQAASGGVGRVQLVDAELAAVGVAGDVDEDVAQTPIHEPRRHRFTPFGASFVNLLQRNFQLVQLVVACLVHARRLAGGADEQAAEQVRQGRVVVPVQDQAGEQFGLAQEGAVVGRRAAQHEVVAAAGAGVAAVDHEFFARQPAFKGRLVEEFGVVHQFAPVVRGLDVGLDHAGVGGDLKHLQALVARRRIAFEHHGQLQLLGRRFDGGHQRQVVVHLVQRRHEDVDDAAAGFQRVLGDRGLVRAAGGPLGLGSLVVALDLGQIGVGRMRAHRVAHFHHQRGARHPAGGFVALRLSVFGVEGAAGCGVWLGQRVVGLGIRVFGEGFGQILIGHPRQAAERQPIAHRRIARHQHQPVVAEPPAPGEPARALIARHAGQKIRRVLQLRRGAQRQQPADHLVQALREDAAQARALLLVGQFRIKRIDVDRQATLGGDVVPGVFVAGADRLGADAQPLAQRADEALGVFGLGLLQLALVGQQRGVVPQRRAIRPPEQAERPARQLLAGVPLALAQVQKALRTVAVFQLVKQLQRKHALGGPQRSGVPFRPVAVVDADKGRLAAHGQAHVVFLQLQIDRVAQLQDGAPLFVVVGQGDARRFVDARDGHLVRERHLGRVDQPLDRRRARWLRRAGERNVAFARQQAAGRVQPDPAGARQIHLAPGVQVGEVHLGAARAVERLLIGLQLNQITRHEAGRKSAMAQQLHQQPARIAARAAGVLQRLLGRLHAGFHADQVVDVVLQALVDADQKVDGALRPAVHASQVVRKQIGRWRKRQVRCQLFFQ